MPTSVSCGPGEPLMHSRIPAGHPARPALRTAGRAPACLLALVCLVAGPVPAQTADSLSFERAQALATERAPMLVARQASVDAALQLRISADQLPDPRLTAGIDNLPIGGPDRYTLGRDSMTQRSI